MSKSNPKEKSLGSLFTRGVMGYSIHSYIQIGLGPT